VKYIVWLNGQESHPFSLGGLQQAVAAEEVPANCVAREFYSRRWRPITDVLGQTGEAAVADQHYVLWNRKRETPPLSRGELQHAISTRAVSLSTLARKAESSDWRPLSEFFIAEAPRAAGNHLLARFSFAWLGRRARAA
jgi:hypothetical protein